MGDGKGLTSVRFVPWNVHLAGAWHRDRKERRKFLRGYEFAGHGRSDLDSEEAENLFVLPSGRPNHLRDPSTSAAVSGGGTAFARGASRTVRTRTRARSFCLSPENGADSSPEANQRPVPSRPWAVHVFLSLTPRSNFPCSFLQQIPSM